MTAIQTQEKPITHGGSDRRWKICKCSKCGIEEQCTPRHDFYVPSREIGNEEPSLLYCERCMLQKL